MGSTGRQLEGVLAVYDSPEKVVEAMEKVKAANYQKFDAFTPYPIHGMDGAMGIKRSILPYITFLFGVTGFTFAFALQYWTSVISWPINVGGKPFNSWPAFVPVMFECTVLFAGISTVLGLFALCRLPNVTRKIPDPRFTIDKFGIMIEAPCVWDDGHGGVVTEKQDPKFKRFDEQEAKSLLSSTGALEVKSVYKEGWF